MDISLAAFGDTPGHEFHGNQWGGGTGTTDAPHGVPMGVRMHLEGTARGIGKASLRNHLANVHGLAGSPDFEKHNVSRMRDITGGHNRALMTMHGWLHGMGVGGQLPEPPPLPPDNPPAKAAEGAITTHGHGLQMATPSPGRENDFPADTNYAYTDSQGGKHLPIHDAKHVRLALGRLNQTSFESPDAKKSAARKILAAAKAKGVDVADDSNAKDTVAAAELTGPERATMFIHNLFTRHGPNPTEQDIEAEYDLARDQSIARVPDDAIFGDSPGHQFRGNQWGSGGAGGGDPFATQRAASQDAGQHYHEHDVVRSAGPPGSKALGRAMADHLARFHGMGGVKPSEAVAVHGAQHPEGTPGGVATGGGTVGRATYAETTGLYAIDTGAPVRLGEGNPIPFLTTGDWQFDEYGDFQVTHDDLVAVKQNFDDQVRRQELPIINEHHDPTRAVGWIKSLDFDGDNRLMATPDWTPLGQQLVTDGAYKYTSPEVNYRTLLLRNWADPEVHEVKHPIVASGLAITNFPKIKALGAIKASEGHPGCELLAFGEVSKLRFDDGGGDDTDDDGDAGLKTCPTCGGDGDIKGGNMTCPDCKGKGKVPSDFKGGEEVNHFLNAATTSVLLRMAVGNSPEPPASNSITGPQTTTGVSPMPDTPEPTVTEPVATEPPAPVAEPVAAPAPVAAVVAAAESESALLAEQTARRQLEVQLAELQTTTAAMSEQLRATARRELVGGIRAEFEELRRDGRITPAEIRSLLPDDDHAVKLSENRFVIDTYKSRPKNSAIPFGEMGRTEDVSTDPIERWNQQAAALRTANPKLSKEAAFAEAMQADKDAYTEYAQEHYSRARSMS